MRGKILQAATGWLFPFHDREIAHGGPGGRFFALQGRAMRIFQILEFNQFNTGSVHQMFQAAAGLQERGHDVTIISRPDATLEAKSREVGVTFRGLKLRHQFDIASILALRRLVNRERPDVIHVHKGIAHAIAFAATAGHSVGAFIVNRGVSFPLDRWNRTKYRTDRVDRVVTVCQQIKDVIVESGGLPESKVVVVFAGTDVHHFDPASWDARAFRREKGIANDAFVVAQVGVRDWKGWRELIDSISDIVPNHPKVHLLLIGCRSEVEKHEVREYARSAGVSDHVTPIEYRSDMPNVLASCDVMVDASWAGTGITGDCARGDGHAEGGRGIECRGQQGTGYIRGSWLARSDERSSRPDGRIAGDPRGSGARGRGCRERATARRRRLLERVANHTA